MQLKCIITDEEKGFLEIVKKYLQKIPSLELLQTFYDVNTTSEFLQNNNADLLFIDINLPKGLELVHSLKNKLMIIFTTAYKKYALKGFELNAIDYLLKPVEFERFRNAADKAMQLYSLNQYSIVKENKSLLIRSEHKTIKIELSDIEYIEAFVDYIKIHLINQKPVLTLMTLKSVIEKLPPDEFRRIHRSYIIPLSKVKSVQRKKVVLVSSKQLPISSSYIDFINQWKETR